MIRFASLLCVRLAAKVRATSLLFSALLSLSFLIGASIAIAANPTNAGKEFISSFLPQFTGSNVELHLSSSTATTVRVEYPVNSPTFVTDVAVNPGAITIVVLPSNAASDWVSGAVGNNAVHMTSSNEFVAYLINRYPATSDAGMALPLPALNTEYIVLDYNQANFGPGFSAEFLVTAVFDNTTVTIKPVSDLEGGHLAGVPFDVTLNRGEGYLAKQLNSGINGGNTGTIVQANKPVTMTNGNYCTQVPVGTTACDHIFEVAQPVQSWGTNAIGANLPDRPGGTIYRIVAAEDNTAVTQDGVAIGNINRGAFLEIGPIAGNHFFSADKAIFVAQYMTGNNSQGATTGDPAMGNVIPSAQFLPSYTFSTVGGGQFALHFVTITAHNNDLNAITLDGVAIGAAQFSAVTGTDYSVAVLPLSEGSHITSAPSGHGITVEGYNGYDSYLYAAGARFTAINPSGDSNPPVCTSRLEVGPPLQVFGTGSDNRPTEDLNNNGVLDPGEDLNANGRIDSDAGVFSVELLQGAVNAQLTVDPFVPGAGQVNWRVDRIDQNVDGAATVRVTDGSGNTCEAQLALAIASTPAPTTPIVTCTSSDAGSLLLAMDGSGLSLAQITVEAAKQARRSGNISRNQYAKIANAARAAYAPTWTAAWSTPRESKSCVSTPASFCANVDQSASLVQFDSLLNAQKKNLDQVLSSLKGKLKASASKKLSKLGNAAYQRGLDASSKVIRTTSVCGA